MCIAATADIDDIRIECMRSQRLPIFKKRPARASGIARCVSFFRWSRNRATPTYPSTWRIFSTTRVLFIGTSLADEYVNSLRICASCGRTFVGFRKASHTFPNSRRAPTAAYKANVKTPLFLPQLIGHVLQDAFGEDPNASICDAQQERWRVLKSTRKVP